MINIFYSWQSDLPSSSNRNLIKDALEKAIKSLNKGSEEIKIEMRIDTATDSLSGSPDIAASIFNKISNSHIFICDTTIINPSSRIEKLTNFFAQKSKRLTPNPNVLIELGFAASSLGWDKIICVVNTSQSQVEYLPFDIRGRRMCTYNYAGQSGKPEIKKQLSEYLKSALIDVMSSVESINDTDLISTILCKKFIDCINYLGVFFTYFLANELGHKEAELIVNKTLCTGFQSYEPSAIETIVNVFEKKDLQEPSNAISTTGAKLSWQEFLITAFERIYGECENLLTKYGSSGNPNLIIELERIKDVSRSMIDFTNSHNSSYMQETSSKEVRRKVYANSFLKPYLLEVMRTRILAIKYMASSGVGVKTQPTVLPGEKLKTYQ